MTAEEIIVCFCGQQIDVYSHEMFLAVVILFMLNGSNDSVYAQQKQRTYEHCYKLGESCV
jgi:hypothetical protein